MNELMNDRQNAIALLSLNDESDFPVDGRELHQKLGVETPYHKWFLRMTAFGFYEGTDFVSTYKLKDTKNPKNPLTTITDHMLSMDMAKHIALMLRTREGQKIRQYLIDVENSMRSPERILEKGVKIANGIESSYYSSLIEKLETEGTLKLAQCLRIIPREYIPANNSSTNKEIDRNFLVKPDFEIFISFNQFMDVYNHTQSELLSGGYIYIIEWGEHVKIGSSKNVRSRLMMHYKNAECYGNTHLGKIAVSVCHANYKSNERTLHTFFKGKRIKGTELFDVPLKTVIHSINDGSTGIVFLATENA